jgi:hypothetical protein
VDREPYPAALFGRQPWCGADIELCGEVADAAEGCFISYARSAAVVFDEVSESIEVLPVDFVAQQFAYRSGIVCWISDREVQVLENRPALPA